MDGSGIEGRGTSPLRLTWATLAAAFGAAVIYFDLGPAVPFVDDAVYAWYVRALAAGRGFVSFPDFVPLALTHRLIGLVGTLGHPDLRLLRLTVFPFLALAAWSTYAVARRLGASGAWATVGAFALAANPITLSLATSFMTDVVFLGLFMAAVFFGLRWIEEGTGRAWMAATTLLAVGERQVGVSAAVAISVGLLLRWRQGRRVDRADQVWLGGLWTGVAILSLLSVKLGAQPTASVGSGALTSAAVEARQLVDWLVFAPGMCGFIFLPFLPVCWRRARRSIVGWRWGALAAACTLGLALTALAFAGGVLPSGHLNVYGLGPEAVSMDGFGSLRLGHPVVQFPKPVVFPVAVIGLLAIGSLATSCAAAYCAARDRGWMHRLGQPVTAFLLLSGLIQVPLLALVSHYDRYYISALAPLVPIAAQRATRWATSTWSASALPVLLAFLAIYIVGQQDYESWQGARDAVARQLYARVDRASVDAGWETNFQYTWIPAYEQGRKVSAPTRFHLEFAAPGDQREGRGYSSVAPGRVVVASGPAPTPP